MDELFQRFPSDWREAISPFVSQKDLSELMLKMRLSQEAVYPPKDLVFRAFELTCFDRVSVVLLGQDPYHGENEACGLCFAVKEGVKIPPSLKNIIKELKNDLNVDLRSTELVSWAKQGVLLLNRTLTVFKDQPLSHKDWGWDHLTLACLKALIKRGKPLVFMCLGKPSLHLITKLRVEFHPEIRVIEAPHPSPLSAYRGFFGSKIFSKTNQALLELGLKPIRFEE